MRLDEREARRYGVHSVPYFVIANKYAAPGAMPVDVIERILKDVIKESKEDEAKKSAQGMSCGPDGCKFES